jgi:hypothetical protein
MGQVQTHSEPKSPEYEAAKLAAYERNEYEFNADGILFDDHQLCLSQGLFLEWQWRRARATFLQHRDNVPDCKRKTRVDDILAEIASNNDTSTDDHPVTPNDKAIHACLQSRVSLALVAPDACDFVPSPSALIGIGGGRSRRQPTRDSYPIEMRREWVSALKAHCPPSARLFDFADSVHESLQSIVSNLTYLLTNGASSYCDYIDLEDRIKTGLDAWIDKDIRRKQRQEALNQRQEALEQRKRKRDTIDADAAAINKVANNAADTNASDDVTVSDDANNTTVAANNAVANNAVANNAVATNAVASVKAECE